MTVDFSNASNMTIWNKVVLNNCGSPLHSWEWARAKELTGTNVEWFFVNNDCLSTAIPICIHKRFGFAIGWVPNGLSYKGDHSSFIASIRKFMREKGIFVLLSDWMNTPNVGLSSESMIRIPFMRTRETFFLDLSQHTPDSLLSVYNATTRKHIRRSERNGITCDLMSTEDMKEFYFQYTELATQKGFAPSVQYDFFKILYNLIDLNNRDCLTHFSRKATLSGSVLGYISVLSIGKNALEFLRVDKKEGKTQFSSKFLTHTVILDALQKGSFYYDFGGVDKKNQPGIYGFKRGFGGKLVKTSGFRMLK